MNSVDVPVLSCLPLPVNVNYVIASTVFANFQLFYLAVLLSFFEIQLKKFAFLYESVPRAYKKREENIAKTCFLT
jgi:hypothetical protein